MKVNKVNIVIKKDTHEYYAFCPEMKGCQSQGDSLDEVLSNIKEAVDLYLETLSSEEKQTCLSRIIEVLDIVKRAKALGDYDSNVIGMAAEVIAEDIFGMVKASVGTRNIDGHIVQNGVKASVQVKSFSSGRVLRYKGGTFFRIPENGSEKLIVLLIYSNLAEYEVLYNGSAKTVGKKENNQARRIVRLDSLKKQSEVDAIIQKCNNT